MLGAALIGAGCIFGQEGDRDLSEFFEPITPPEEETLPSEQAQAQAAEPQASTPVGEVTRPPTEDLLDLSVAPRTSIEAVQKFYAQIEAGQFEQAYRLVSLETRELISEEEFAQRYRDIWDEATIVGLTWEVLPPQTEFVAGLDVLIRYETEFFGEIEDRVFAATRRQPGWIVDWSPDLIFDGLGARDHLIHRFVEVPERGDILDRNGVVLATQGEIAIVGVVQDFIDEGDEDAVIAAFTSRLNVDEQVVRDLVFQDIRS
ncbi:MAG TPA: NTF2-like N-terminal transpeptidase domain-containing protein, partial [Dehalococcoidia bacterium]|nr:NTF2-like N-terminal transpeptidase domain-containing protein [Dehalococcoidia bacterium]